MKAIPAVFENGVFRPTGPVDLPEGCEVMVEPKAKGAVQPRPSDPQFAHLEPGQARIYAIMSERYNTGQIDLAQRHDAEHLPSDGRMNVSRRITAATLMKLVLFTAIGLAASLGVAIANENPFLYLYTIMFFYLIITCFFAYLAYRACGLFLNNVTRSIFPAPMHPGKH